MENSANNYLTNILEEGKKLNIVLFSHNSCWPHIQILDDCFVNCNVTVFGSSTSYLKSSNTKNLGKIENCDLIIFYSSKFYNEEELEELKNIALKISNDNNKTVSVGYLYVIPFEQRRDEDISEQIKIIIIKNGEDFVEEIYPTCPFSVYDLTNLTLITTRDYDEFRQKREKKI